MTQSTMTKAIQELQEEMFEVQEKCTGALTEIKLIREAIAAMQHEAYHAEGIVKMIADLTARVEALESSTHQVPIKQPTGRWICDDCGKDWGDGHEIDLPLEIPKRGKYICYSFAGGCGERSVTWHEEPKAYPDSAGNVKSTAEESSTVQAGNENLMAAVNEAQPKCDCGELLWGVKCTKCGKMHMANEKSTVEESSTVQAGTEPITSAEIDRLKERLKTAWLNTGREVGKNIDAQQEIARLKAENAMLKNIIGEIHDKSRVS